MDEQINKLRALAEEVAAARELCLLCAETSRPFWEGVLLVLEAAFEELLDDPVTFDDVQFEWPRADTPRI